MPPPKRNIARSPTWSRSAEPDAYTTDLDGDILLGRGNAEDEICIETISAHSVHLDEAYENGAESSREYQLRMSSLKMLRRSDSTRTILTLVGNDAFRAGLLRKPSYTSTGH